jgi:eukaryotic-like serine/threonine-protein kinase
MNQELPKETSPQSKREGKPGPWFPTIPLLILSILCILFALFGLRSIPPRILAAGLGTVAMIGKPTQTPTATFTATITSTSTPLPTTTPSPTPLPPMPPTDAAPKATWVSPVDGMVLIHIPNDQYLIGSLDSDSPASISEKPQHKVNLNDYWMDKTEVTNAMYAMCVQAGVCPEKTISISFTRDAYFGDTEFDDFPVIYVTWNEAQTYCTWAGRRLPTEAEWEVAARGTDKRKFPWGNSAPNCNLLNFGGGLANYCTGDTTAVGKYPQGGSPYGVLDMAGNVWEWVADWYGSNYIVEPHDNPVGFATGELKVLRGGSWFNKGEFVRSAFRIGHDPADPTEYIGFRCTR